MMQINFAKYLGQLITRVFRPKIESITSQSHVPVISNWLFDTVFGSLDLSEVLARGLDHADRYFFGQFTEFGKLGSLSWYLRCCQVDLAIETFLMHNQTVNQNSRCFIQLLKVILNDRQNAFMNENMTDGTVRVCAEKLGEGVVPSIENLFQLYTSSAATDHKEMDTRPDMMETLLILSQSLIRESRYIEYNSYAHSGVLLLYMILQLDRSVSLVENGRISREGQLLHFILRRTEDRLHELRPSTTHRFRLEGPIGHFRCFELLSYADHIRGSV